MELTKKGLQQCRLFLFHIKDVNRIFKHRKENNMEYVLTEEGKRKVAVFIKECEAKRKEILDAGLDTAEDTQIQTEADILSDLNNGVGVDEDGDYYNAWGVTDNYCSDRACELAIGEDFVSNTTRVQVTLRKTIDATPEDLEMIERGENPFFGKMEDICNEQCGKTEFDYQIVDEDTGKTLVDWD